MLNNDDLKKIKGVVHEAIQEETPPILEKALKPVKKDIRKIKKDIFECRWVDEDGLDHWYLAV